MLNKIHVKIQVNQQEFSNMASDWLAAVLPASQIPSLKMFLNKNDLNMFIKFS